MSIPSQQVKERPPVILVVEDNLINQKVAVNMLEGLGVDTEVAEHGQEALEVLRECDRVSLVLMDLQMPIMDGVTCAAAIRNGEAGEQYRDVSIVALTANTSDEHRKACEEVKMNGFMGKPVSLMDFQATVKAHLPDRKRHQSK